jgi:hypothetical protein
MTTNNYLEKRYGIRTILVADPEPRTDERGIKWELGLSRARALKAQSKAFSAYWFKRAAADKTCDMIHAFDSESLALAIQFDSLLRGTITAVEQLETRMVEEITKLKEVLPGALRMPNKGRVNDAKREEMHAAREAALLALTELENLVGSGL